MNRKYAIRTNSYRLKNVIVEDLSEQENDFERRWSLTGQGVALKVPPRVVSTCRKHGRGAENDLGFSDVVGEPGRAGRDTVVVFDEGVGFNMNQLAPRTRIIADTYVPFRWKAGLCPTFCCRRGKNNDLSHLIPDSAAAAKRRTEMKN